MKIILLVLVTLVSVTTHAQIENGMLVHFPFDNNLTDVSSNAIDGVNIGTTFGPDRNGVVGNALVLGNDKYVTLNSSAVKTSLPITISVWVKLNSLNGAHIIFTSDNIYNNYYGYWLSVVGGTGQLVLNFAGGLGGQLSSNRKSFTTNNSLTVNEWHHIVATINSENNMLIYVDCVKELGTYSGSGSSNIAYSGSESRIGCNIGNNFNPEGSYFNGSIDQLVIWNRVLSPSEINMLCSRGNKLSINDLNSESNLASSVFPNPTDGPLNFNFNENSSTKNIKLFDVSGKLLFEESLVNVSSYSLDISKFNSQVYFVEVSDGNNVKYHKVIKK